MSENHSGNVSFDIDKRARLFAFDLDREGKVGLLPLFRDLCRVFDVIDEYGGRDPIGTNEVRSRVLEDNETELVNDTGALLVLLQDAGYVEEVGNGKWEIASSGSGSNGSGVTAI